MYGFIKYHATFYLEGIEYKLKNKLFITMNYLIHDERQISISKQQALIAQNQQVLSKPSCKIWALNKAENVALLNKGFKQRIEC